MEEQIEESTEKQPPLLKLEGAQAAVIREILSKLVTPSEIGDLASVTLLDASEYENDTTFCKFHKYGNVYISDTNLSDETMDRFVAAWIKWKSDHWQPPVEEGLGEIDDHPF